MSNEKKGLAVRFGGWGVKQIKNVVGWNQVSQHGKSIISLGKDVLVYRPKGEAVSSYADLQQKYDFHFSDAVKLYRIYRLNFFILSAFFCIDLGIMLKSVYLGDIQNILVCLSMASIFGLSAFRYAYGCFQTRTRQIVKPSVFVAAPWEWLPTAWAHTACNQRNWGKYRS